MIHFPLDFINDSLRLDFHKQANIRNYVMVKCESNTIYNFFRQDVQWCAQLGN